MVEENQKTEDIIQKKIDEIGSNFLEYIKVIALSFIIPMWIVIFLNGIATLWKMMSWSQLDVKFWTNETYSSLTLILLIVIPIGYLIWFYHLTIKRTLLKIHDDLLIDWNREIGNLCAKSLIELENKNKENKKKFDVNIILIYINKKLNRLPKVIQWVTRKLIDKIPFIELINSFDYNDLKAENEDKLSKSITNKINDFELDYIDMLVPKWGVFIIPLNIILLISYMRL